MHRITPSDLSALKTSDSAGTSIVGEATVDAFILTREWRDSGRYAAAGANEILLWCTGLNGDSSADPSESPSGTILVRIKPVDVVCFVSHEQKLPGTLDDMRIERRALELQNPSGEPVDGLYFPNQRALNHARDECRAAGVRLFESDVRPLDRYLMERFIRAGVRISGQFIKRNGFSEFINPKLRACELNPPLHCVALDIETDGFEGPLLSVAMHSNNAGVRSECVIIVARPQDVATTDFPVKAVLTEGDALRAMLQWFAEYDPDVITGWNVIGFDLIALERRFAQHGLVFALGRNGQSARVLPAQGASSMPLALVPGRVVLDGIECLRAAFFTFEDFRLDAVANRLLGHGKLIADDTHDRLAEILRLHREDPAGLAAYNLEDCRLVAQIFEHTNLLHMSISRAQLTGLGFGRHGGSVASLDNLYLPRLIVVAGSAWISVTHKPLLAVRVVMC